MRCPPTGTNDGRMTPASVSSARLDVLQPGHNRIDPEHSAVTIGTRHLFGLAPHLAGTEELIIRLDVCFPLPPQTARWRDGAGLPQVNHGE